MTLSAWWMLVRSWATTKKILRLSLTLLCSRLLEVPLPLSSRPERSAVERSAVCPSLTAATGYDGPPLCHLDRSAAQWRDLRLPFPEPLSRAITALPFVISTGAQRSGEICGSADPSWKCFSCALQKNIPKKEHPGRDLSLRRALSKNIPRKGLLDRRSLHSAPSELRSR
jgi:hypothetical protein